jgi:magnesium transporter
MARHKIRKRRISGSQHKAKPGAAPGELTVSPLSYPTQLLVMAYGPDGFVEHECKTVEEIHMFTNAWPVVLINVIGLGNLDIIEKIGAMFALERLSLEDVLDTGHSPKVEYYEHYIFSIIKGGYLGDQLDTEQFSMFLKKNVVIVFEEKPNNSSFSNVRERIRRGIGRIRASGTDYLYYALIDEVIDRYFPILDSLNNQLTKIENEIISSGYSNNSYNTILEIHHSKSDLLLLHRTVWPVSDLINMLIREETPLITKATRIFLRDCLDHSKQASELTQFYRDTASGLLNTFLAYEGHKTNEIFKVLTMVSSVLIPLNFIAGVYGMNFASGVSPFNMPELSWYYGYPFALFLMLITALFMLLYFKHRGWVTYRRKS